MEVRLPADLTRQVERELATGRYHTSDQLIEEAVRYFLEDRERSQRRLDALRRVGQAVDEAGLYERVLVPSQECPARLPSYSTRVYSPTSLCVTRCCVALKARVFLSQSGRTRSFSRQLALLSRSLTGRVR